MNCPAGTPNGVEAIDQMTASQLLSLAAERMGDEERESIVKVKRSLEARVTRNVARIDSDMPDEQIEDWKRVISVLAALLPGEPRD